MDTFIHSSHFRHWIKTSNELLEIRTKENQDSIERVKESFRKDKELDPTVKIPVQFITVQDQIDLVSFYTTKISDYCKVFKFQKTIQYTCVLLFKRFYLVRSIMEYDIKLVLLSCLFLSTKIEHLPIGLSEFLQKIPKGPQEGEMLDLELLVSMALNFEYQVHHPDWPLEGFYLDMQVLYTNETFINQTFPKVERQEQVQKLFNSYEQCSDLISIAYNSDLPLLCTPSQIALSLLYMQDLSFMNDYINSRFENQNIDGLLKMITSIIEIIKNVKVTSKESASRIAKLNDQCFSREYLKTSKLYKQKHEREIVGKEEEDVFQ